MRIIINLPNKTINISAKHGDKNDRRNGKSKKGGGGGGSAIAEMTFVRSTTITGELLSTCGGHNTEQETIDAQIASLESLSDESETLLKQQKIREESWGSPITTKLCLIGLDGDEEEGIICRRSSNGEGIIAEDEQTDRTDGTSYL